MKYFLLTITFFIVTLLLIGGLIFYDSYALWMKNKQEILERLEYLKDTLKEVTVKEISLAPDLSRSKNTVIYDRNLQVIGEFSTGKRKIISSEAMPLLITSSLVLMEDKRFYSHSGFDIRGIAGALLEDIRTLSFARGGSTITQQLAKILFTDSKRTIRRKLYELFCTIEIEKRFSKQEILSLYLNSIYFGHNNYGIVNAARFYFKKDVFDIDLFETSLLTGMIPGPNRYSPLLYPERVKRKQKIVLNKLIANGTITKESAVNGFDSFWERFNQLRHQPNVSIWSMEKNNAPYFVEYIRQYLENKLGVELIKGGGLRIFTTLDLEKQRIAEDALGEGLSMQTVRTEEIKNAAGSTVQTDTSNPTTIERNVEGALIALHPRNGHILSMVGGSGFTFDNQFNRAVYARRQMGSAFKPFVYAAALETQRYHPETELIDRPLEIVTSDGIWRPSNYNDVYFGKVSLSFALKKSLNSVAVQLHQEIGPDKVAELIGKALDLDGEEISQRFKPYLSSALGVYALSPLEVVRAYSIFPNKGEKIFPLAVLRVEDLNGKVLLNDEREAKKLRTEYDLQNNLRIIQIETAETVNRMLVEVVRKGGTAYSAMLSSGLSFSGSGKTGTTNDYTDAWFIGYTEDIIAAVWIGFDDPRHSLGEGQAGGVVAAPIWSEFMKKALWRG
jgi:penicillin-binding protein 1A